MTLSHSLRLAIVLGSLGSGLALAGAGDITLREQDGGSVELSNLGEESAPVLVAAPVRPVAESAARPASVAAARPVGGGPLSVRGKRAKDKGSAEKDDEEAAIEEQAEELASTRYPERGEDAAGASGRAESGGREAYANAGSTNGTGGFGAGSSPWNSGAGMAGSAGGWPGGGAPASGGADAASNGGNGGSSGSSGGSSGAGGGIADGSTGGNAGTGNGATNPTSVLDSPEMLAARAEQYRQMMLAEQRGANGLVANPSVQRRYLMINRSGYQALGL